MTDGPSPEEISAKFRDYRRTRRRRTRNELVELHIGFAHNIARRFARRGVAEEDLQQIALLGLVKSVDRFDPDVGAAFTSFAGRTIEGEIKRHFRDSAWSVHVPRTTKELHLRVRAATDSLGHDLGRAPSVAEVADHLEVSQDEVVEALSASAAFSPVSLDAAESDDETVPGAAGWLSETDRRLGAADDRLLVQRLVEGLPQREQEIVRLRFFEELTQSEIAERLGISQMHVSRLLRRSFEAMRAHSEHT